MKKIVTVDGPAGSGKSTIAKLLANRIGFRYLDTGALYRAASFFYFSKGVTAKDTAKVVKLIPEIKIRLDKERVFLDNVDVTDKLRTKEVTGEVANFAKIPEIRKLIRNIQLQEAASEQIIVDGRDIGTEVFPDAFCKFYLDATPAVRAQRRLKDSKEENQGQAAIEIEKDLRARDLADRTREISPLRIPIDALSIDSTELTVDQVMDKMVQYYNRRLTQNAQPNSTLQSDDSKMFMDALDNIESNIKKTVGLEPGTLIKAKIIKVGKEVQLDIDQKRDGIISAEETAKLNPADLVIGSTIDVYVMANRTNMPQIFVSKLEADKRQGQVKVKELFEKKEPVKGKVTAAIKGGFLVDLFGVEAFCPFSEFDVRRVGKDDVTVGIEDLFEIIEFRAGEKFIVSRKKLLEKKYAGLQDGYFANAHVGDIVEGKVVNMTDFGVFIEIAEGVTAILRPRNISWKRVESFGTYFKKGDHVKGKVILLDAATRKVEISKKDVEEDPFIPFTSAHPEGSQLKAVVRRLESFGAFVELESGVEGLLHISEMSWTKRISHPNEILKPGDEVEVKILGVDVANRRISLGLKQVMANPWDSLEMKYPQGTMVKAEIRSVLKNGVYLMVDGEFEGYIHVGDISWGNDQVAVEEMFKEGQTIDAKVLMVNTKKKRIELGLKQATSNPYEDLKANYGVGGSIEAEVVRLTENGAVVKVGEELEGFCHLSQLSRDKVERPEDAVKVGQKYTFLIQSVDEKAKKISLSIREHLNREEQAVLKNYSGDEGKSRITLGDLLGN